MAQDTHHFPATVVATKSFTTTYDGEPVEITAGRDHLVGDHEIVRRHSDAFRPLPEQRVTNRDRFKPGFVRYALEHGMDAAFEHLVEIRAFWEYAEQERRMREQAKQQPTREQRDEVYRRFMQRREQESRTAYTRARNKIYGALVLPGDGQVAVGARQVRAVASRERRERPRARRCVASRDGPDGELDPPQARPERRS